MLCWFVVCDCVVGGLIMAGVLLVSCEFSVPCCCAWWLLCGCWVVCLWLVACLLVAGLLHGFFAVWLLTC